MKNKIYYKLGLITTLILGSTNVSAMTCLQFAKVADENSLTSNTTYTYSVKGKKGFKTYFHSAPLDQCKISGLFIIPKDSVMAYQYFKNQNKDWMYVTYYDENGKETSGWVLERDFIKSGYINSNE